MNTQTIKIADLYIKNITKLDSGYCFTTDDDRLILQRTDSVLNYEYPAVYRIQYQEFKKGRQVYRHFLNCEKLNVDVNKYPHIGLRIKDEFYVKSNRWNQWGNNKGALILIPEFLNGNDKKDIVCIYDDSKYETIPIGQSYNFDVFFHKCCSGQYKCKLLSFEDEKTQIKEYKISKMDIDVGSCVCWFKDQYGNEYIDDQANFITEHFYVGKTFNPKNYRRV